MIDWHQVDTVLLDMDGTLLDLHYDNHFWNDYLPGIYAQKHGLPVQETREQLISQFRAELGKLEFYCTTHWSQQLDMEIVALKQQHDDKIQFLPGAAELLRFLASRDLQTLLVTNAHRDVLDIKQRVIKITDHVDEAYVSHDFGYPKEDAQFWQAFSEHVEFNPTRTVFVDDNMAVLDAAKQFGIRYCIQPLQPDSQQSAKSASETHHLPIQSLTELIPD